uniref:Uncharacterized protein n=1 Tax=Micrococcus phage Kurnik TaxID=3092208 RepID=A0AAU6R669_9CAUD
MDYKVGDILEAIGDPERKLMILAENQDVIFTAPVHEGPGASWTVSQQSRRKLAKEYRIKWPHGGQTRERQTPPGAWGEHGVPSGGR